MIRIAISHPVAPLGPERLGVALAFAGCRSRREPAISRRDGTLNPLIEKCRDAFNRRPCFVRLVLAGRMLQSVRNHLRKHARLRRGVDQVVDDRFVDKTRLYLSTIPTKP